MINLDIFVKFLVISFCGISSTVFEVSGSQNLDADITDIVFNKGAINSIISAYGDFDSDEITDVFTLSTNHHIIDIWLGSENENILLQIRPDLRCNHSDLEITNIVPGDFDGDAFMDVMFTAKLKDDMLGVYVNWGASDKIVCTPPNSEPLIRTKGEPIALDYKDDMVIDLFGVDEDNNRRLWIFRKYRQGIDTILLLNTSIDKSYSPISIPHSNAILDLDGDNLADLFIKTDHDFEIWLAYGKTIDERSYRFDHRIHLPTGFNKVVGQAIFLDLELEGHLSLLVPVCHDEKCSNSSILTSSNKKLNVDLGVNFVDPEGKLWGFVPPNKKDFYRQTITLREGDFNMDGYPDLIATLAKDGGATIKTFLLKNVENKKRNAGRYKRTFEVLWNALLPNKNDTVMGSFYDFYQDGILDVILLQKKNENIVPLAFRNTLDYDANFVKVIVLTGLSNETKPATRTPLGRKKRTYGTNLPGPSIIYSTTTQEGDPQKGASAQLPQSAYMQLHLPYTIFGLGRTPNFVDEVVVGLSQHSRKWQQLIPNSQILVIPNPPNEPSLWKAQLFVTPSKIILKSVFALGGICLVILLIILVLHLKERREDRLEKLQSAHQFHFDAM